MDQGNRERPFAHGGRDSLDGCAPHVTDREDARHRRFVLPTLPAAGFRTGQDVAPLVAFDLWGEPFGEGPRSAASLFAMQHGLLSDEVPVSP